MADLEIPCLLRLMCWQAIGANGDQDGHTNGRRSGELPAKE